MGGGFPSAQKFHALPADAKRPMDGAFRTEAISLWRGDPAARGRALPRAALQHARQLPDLFLVFGAIRIAEIDPDAAGHERRDLRVRQQQRDEPESVFHRPMRQVERPEGLGKKSPPISFPWPPSRCAIALATAI